MQVYYQEDNEQDKLIEETKSLTAICDSMPAQWQEINQALYEFQNGIVDQPKPHAVRDIVLKSWVRSKRLGSFYDKSSMVKMLKPAQLNKILKDNKVLLKTAVPLFTETLSFLGPDSQYTFGLIDNNGVSLIACYSHVDILSQPGLDLSEESVGTTSHSICTNLDKPILLVSPENYNEILRTAQVAVSVPIHDSRDKIIASLVMACYKDFQKIKDNKEVLQWIVAYQLSLAKNIEAEMLVAEKKYNMVGSRILSENMTENKDLPQVPANPSLNLLYIDNIFGQSPEMIKAKAIAKKAVRSRNSILLTGESGTGKELFARAIHNESCQDGPFVAMNCSAIPRSLVESELFGYERGSFTGAEKSGRAGKFELANGGTLFLDEIGDMPMEIQPIILRVLEDHQIMRIGGNRYIPLNFRIIAATNKNLMESVANKEFREDLYYRLAVFKISIPPLRDRENDIMSLAWYFIQNECRYLGIKPFNMEASVIKLLQQYTWPGNVRQLKNAMCYAVNIAEDGIIKLNDLPEEIIGGLISDKTAVNRPRSLAKIEEEAMKNAMLYTNNNIGSAAELLEMSRSTFYRKLKEYNLYKTNN